MTLSHDDLITLCKILDSGMSGAGQVILEFRIWGQTETLTSLDVDSFAELTFPREVYSATFSANAIDKHNKIFINLNALSPKSNHFTITSPDKNWSILRKNELDEFFAEHGNSYWWFHKSFVQLLGIPIVGWLLYRIYQSLDLLRIISEDYRAPISAIFWVVGFVLFAVLQSNITKVFPFILIDTRRKSPWRTLRQDAKWIAITIMTIIIADYILRPILKS